MALIPPCEPCQTIICALESDYTANGQALPPVVPPVPETGTIPNSTVYLNFGCPEGYPFDYTGPLPMWITMDIVNSRFIGAPGIFVGGTLEAANASAQAALNAFGNVALAAETVTCGGFPPPNPPFPGSNPTPPPGPPNPPPWPPTPVIQPGSCPGGDTNDYGITGFFDGMFLNTIGGLGPPFSYTNWLGNFLYRSTTGSCYWMSRYLNYGVIEFGQVTQQLTNGLVLCSARLFFDGTFETGAWRLELFAGGQALWSGVKLAGGTTPAGVYTRRTGALGGFDIAPLTVTIGVGVSGSTLQIRDDAACMP